MAWGGVARKTRESVGRGALDDDSVAAVFQDAPASIHVAVAYGDIVLAQGLRSSESRPVARDVDATGGEVACGLKVQ